MKLWSGRFKQNTDELTEQLNASIGFDQRLYREDITVPCPAAMLGARGIIGRDEAEKIIDTLKDILSDIEAGKLRFSADTEDIHIERCKRS
jgi:argininosuccinate lyase